MSTRQESKERPAGRPTRVGRPGRLGMFDPAESVALVARSHRERLLAAHRHRLAREDLEDCYSQATLELLRRSIDGRGFSSRRHIANALEQRLLSRIHDRRRALSGRSPIEAAIATALPLGSGHEHEVEIPDPTADVERLTLLRQELRRIGEMARRLSEDQRLVLASQLSRDMNCSEFCRAHGWTAEKYRKVAQRARARLAQLLATEQLTAGSCSGQPDRFVPPSVVGRIKEQGPTYEHSLPPT